MGHETPEIRVSDKHQEQKDERVRVFAPWLFSIITVQLLSGPCLSGNQLEYAKDEERNRGTVCTQIWKSVMEKTTKLILK